MQRLKISIALTAVLFMVSSAFSSEALTDGERQWLSAHKKIRVGVSPDFPPFEFVDENGRYTGIAADYMQLINKRLGVAYDGIESVQTDEIKSLIKANRLDVIPCLGITQERKTYLIFTTPYLEIPVEIITKKASSVMTLKDLKGKKAAIVSGYDEEELIRRNHSGINIVAVPTMEDGLKAVSFGDVDALIGNVFSVTYHSGKMGISNIKIAGSTGYVYKPAIAVRKDWPELAAIIDKTLQGMTAAEKEDIYRQWVRIEKFGVGNKRLLLVLLLVTVAAAAAVFLLFIWKERLKTSVNEKTRELELSKEELEKAHSELERRVTERTSELREANEKLKIEISQKLSAEIALKESESKYRSLFSSMNDAVALHEVIYNDKGKAVDFRVLDVNPAYEVVIGIPRERAVGTLSGVVFGANSPQFVELFAGVAQKGVALSVEVYLPSIGKHFKMSVFSPAKGRFAAIFSDITEHKILDDALKSSEEKFRELANMLPVIVFEINEKGNFTFTNRCGIETLGIIHETEGVDILTTIGDESVESFKENLAKIVEEQKACGGAEFKLKTKDGRIIPVFIYASAIVYEGTVRGVRGVAVDITERVLFEKALHEKSLQLERLNNELEARVREEISKTIEQQHVLIQQSRLASMGEMIVNIAHQWSQPLSALNLILINIKEASDFNELDKQFVEEFTSKGQQQIKKLAATIDEFRNFFKPDKEKEPFDVTKSIKDALTLLSGSLKNYLISTQLNAAKDITINGYPHEFSQVILNILSTAKEAITRYRSVDGIITVDVYREEQKNVRINITDNGGGIDELLIGSVFEPYLSASGQTGSGISLYTSKRIIEEHWGGSIMVSNVEGGSRFTIVLPM
ncbi:multi-sensor signal transduction histidine kinase [Candidatus Magnetominusculus xianensis]|uniref:histidine kinase n=1 Tax=Candidatus Magnetominusculus xianensis TaxID=1748249 RepID=A0ABR5SIB2_9BACT|nr:multi-sensor signal transduction histidine kinase [Candidatus Magnetominusculus xianensis]